MYQYHFRTRPLNGATPQSQPIEGREAEMVQNSAGGYAFPVDDWTRLDRFLILGSEGGSYYATERALSRENAQAVQRCIAADGIRAVNRIAEISDAGRAAKNEPALYALAMALKLGDLDTRRAAAEAMPRVARIGTHLLHLAEYIQAFGGWGRLTRKAFAGWYLDQPAGRLAYQLAKYQSRDGWTQRDVLRQSHPKPEPGSAHEQLLGWAAGKGTPICDAGVYIRAHEAAKRAEAAKEIVALICEHHLTRESIPTEFLNDRDVWEALLTAMPLTAMLRNLGKMTSIGLVAPASNAASTIAARLGDADTLKRARVHPFSILLALTTYAAGRGVKGSLSWNPVQPVVDALDGAFYGAFDNVGVQGKRILLALDVSGSMTSPISNTHLSCRGASVALAMATAARNDCTVVGFTGNGGWYRSGSTVIAPLEVSPRRRLDDNVRTVHNLPFGATDCALPALWADVEGIAFDAIVIYTDNETWHGSIHPTQALARYRKNRSPACRQVVVGMTSSGFTIADPADAGQMDVVGFDANAPRMIEDFING